MKIMLILILIIFSLISYQVNQLNKNINNLHSNIVILNHDITDTKNNLNKFVKKQNYNDFKTGINNRVNDTHRFVYYNLIVRTNPYLTINQIDSMYLEILN